MNPLILWPIAKPIVKKWGPWLLALAVIGGGHAGCWWRGKTIERKNDRIAALEASQRDWKDAVKDRDQAIHQLKLDVALCNGMVILAEQIGEEWERRCHDYRPPPPAPPETLAEEAITAEEVSEATGQAAEWLREVLQ